MPCESIANPRLYMSLHALSSPLRFSTAPTCLGLGFGCPWGILRKNLRTPPLPYHSPSWSRSFDMQGSGSAVQPHSLKPLHLARTTTTIWAVGNASGSSCVADQIFFLSRPRRFEHRPSEAACQGRGRRLSVVNFLGGMVKLGPLHPILDEIGAAAESRGNCVTINEFESFLAFHQHRYSTLR